MGHPFTSAYALEHPTGRPTLSTDVVHRAQLTAEVWRSRGFTEAADNLLTVLGMATQPREPRPLPEGVADFAAYQRRRQAVTR